MTAQEQVTALLSKLSQPYWCPFPTHQYLTDWHNHVATFNMYYMLRGQPLTHNPGDINRNRSFWDLATTVCRTTTKHGEIGDTVVVLTAPEFYQQAVKVQPRLFSRHLPVTEWERLLCSTKRGIEPANLKIPNSNLRDIVYKPKNK